MKEFYDTVRLMLTTLRENPSLQVAVVALAALALAAYALYTVALIAGTG